MTRADCEIDWPSVAAALEREVETVMGALAEARSEQAELTYIMALKALPSRRCVA
jgi:hypothetical protein